MATSFLGSSGFLSAGLASATFFSSGFFSTGLASGFFSAGLASAFFSSFLSAGAASALMLAANFLGSLVNSTGHLSQQKPTVLPSKASVLGSTTGLPLTGQTVLIGLAEAEAAGAGSGGLGTIMASSSPRLMFTLGSDFLRFSAPAAVTFVCQR